MKRLVFCFDGTWNKLSANTPTNVVITAASIERVTADGITQIIHYDEGVGTGHVEHLSGGMFGVGLVPIMRRAYSFLIFNYEPGDEIYVFGFSRGAFNAIQRPVASIEQDLPLEMERLQARVGELEGIVAQLLRHSSTNPASMLRNSCTKAAEPSTELLETLDFPGATKRNDTKRNHDGPVNFPWSP